ncbi:light-harvesting complex-like protein OHP2, chloroplastic [Cucurbita maxima]|uniref:Light-harvesting complex-like protein OHP2, chloroplastic n=1 Tax=Cucurbita maxima TaxID=3661 RepID=A0A6J1JS47_CUCMA|nr:light-harvesting complex-like protein OHP2, chloroplastic [Cucurbita maxima]
MSGACSFPFAKIKIPTVSSSSAAVSPSASAVSSTSSSSAHSSIRFSSSKPFVFTIRSSQTDGPIRRPAAPSLREPSPPSPPPPLKPTPTSATAPFSQPSAKAYVAKQDNTITLEFQRQKAKELQEYFKQKKLDEADQGPFFGFIGKNEISNGRWAMFGFAVGLLTEYATGSNFVDQVKILLSNFGIVDLD